MEYDLEQIFPKTWIVHKCLSVAAGELWSSGSDRECGPSPRSHQSLRRHRGRDRGQEYLHRGQWTTSLRVTRRTGDLKWGWRAEFWIIGGKSCVKLHCYYIEKETMFHNSVKRGISFLFYAKFLVLFLVPRSGKETVTILDERKLSMVFVRRRVWGWCGWRHLPCVS